MVFIQQTLIDKVLRTVTVDQNQKLNGRVKLVTHEIRGIRLDIYLQRLLFLFLARYGPKDAGESLEAVLEAEKDMPLCRKLKALELWVASEILTRSPMERSWAVHPQGPSFPFCSRVSVNE